MSDKERPEGPMRVDTALVQKLAKMLDDNDLSEIEVEDGDRRIVVKRKLGFAPAPAPVAAAPAPALVAQPAPAAVAPASADANPGAHPGAVKSPMVGTVYLSAEPGAAPFVAVGGKVEAGETLLIIEAMKVMNPIPAPKAGTVRQICVQDAEPVEFDQALVIIE
ncbi:MAG: acetyl-CoA carboxylase biotin carboxyl carrier protein [Sphingosinicella sp.]|uniref:acetyl-CoA carboxylase biotin carboxyl carrier protein n=1 Tax=Sphingosinicella sp. TaxID=1917971 RepID=UPI004037C55E